MIAATVTELSRGSAHVRTAPPRRPAASRPNRLR
jgi:hypothetical protein